MNETIEYKLNSARQWIENALIEIADIDRNNKNGSLELAEQRAYIAQIALRNASSVMATAGSFIHDERQRLEQVPSA